MPNALDVPQGDAKNDSKVAMQWYYMKNLIIEKKSKSYSVDICVKWIFFGKQLLDRHISEMHSDRIRYKCAVYP